MRWRNETLRDGLAVCSADAMSGGSRLWACIAHWAFVIPVAAAQLSQQALQGLLERIDFFRTSHVRPALIHQPAGCHCDRPHSPAAFGQEDQPCTSVVGIWASFDVTKPLQLLDRLRHRLLADMRKPGEFAHLDSFRAHEGEDIGMRWSDIVEACFFESCIDILRPMLVNEPQQQAQ